LPDYTYEAIPLDLESAVTLVATASADMGKRTDLVLEGVMVAGWFKYHAPGVNWRIQDSLDGVHWHSVVEGGLWLGNESMVRRFSSPMGTNVRLAWQMTPVVVVTNETETEIRSRSVCPGRCGIDHADLRVSDLLFNIVIRSF
jgi:hypothetical protein